jgi:hypothetical protein
MHGLINVKNPDKVSCLMTGIQELQFIIPTVILTFVYSFIVQNGICVALSFFIHAVMWCLLMNMADSPMCVY